MAIFRRCDNCHALFDGKRCPTCAKKFDKASRERHEDKQFYGTSLWQKCRRNIRIKYMDYDIWLLGIGIEQVIPHPAVHHIVERNEDPALRYRMDNLITVSKESHEEIHDWYKRDKAYALKRIQQGIDYFNRVIAYG